MIVKSVGIDLGTTNSVLGFINDRNQPECMIFESGVSVYPSVFCFDGERFYTGQAAIDLEEEDHNRIVRSSKRKMGTGHFYQVEDKKFNAIDIAEHILFDMKAQFEKTFNQIIVNAVITVPAYFNDQQRKHTILAAERAGFNVLRLINEPTAAALAYGLKDLKNQNILVYDLGGGTFDVTVMKLTEEGLFEVLSTNGDTSLGGDDFDHIIINYIESIIAKEHPNLVKSTDFSSRIRNVAENAKKALSRSENYTIRLPYCGTDDNKTVNFSCSLTRQKFNELSADLMKKIKKLINEALLDANLKFKDLDHVILVGGSTRLPIVYESVKEWSGKTPNISLNPDEAVALGAAIQAQLIVEDNPQDISLIDVTPLSLGVEIENGLMSIIIGKNTPVPCESFENYTTAYDNQTEVVVNVFQGERAKASDNYNIGNLTLSNIPKMPRGKPEIVVTFSLDINGVLHVFAKEQTSSTEQEVLFDNNTDVDVHKMLEEAETHKDEDEDYKEFMTLKNRLIELQIQIDELIRCGLCDKDQVIDLYDYKESLLDCQNTQNVSAIITIIKGTDTYIRDLRDVLYAKAQTEL